MPWTTCGRVSTTVRERVFDANRGTIFTTYTHARRCKSQSTLGGCSVVFLTVTLTLPFYVIWLGIAADLEVMRCLCISNGNDIKIPRRGVHVWAFKYAMLYVYVLIGDVVFQTCHRS